MRQFSRPGFANVKLASDPFGLYAMKTGKKARGLNSEEISKLEQGYVGKKAKLVVYETGCFSGIPDHLQAFGVPARQDRSFGFSTSRVVLAER